MNKKAFTLIEVMAVIIIIGLLLLIGIPSVTRNVLSSRKSVYKQHEKTLETSAKSYMNECMSNNGKDCYLPDAGKVSKMSLKDFVSMGLIRDGLENPEKSPKYCDDENSYVIVKNKSKKSNSYELDFDICLSCSDYKSNFCESYAETPVCTTCAGPSCGAVVLSNTTWTNKDLTVGVTCVGSEVDCDREVFYEKVTTSTSEHSVTIRDNAGKTESCPVNAYVDKIAPVVEIAIRNEADSSDALDGWTRGLTQVEMTNLYDTLSGINTWGMGTSKKAVYDKSKLYEAKDGISAVYGYGKDNAGNEGRVNTAIEIKRDNQAPTIEGMYFGNQVYPSKPELSSIASNKVSINEIIEEYGDIRGVKIYFSSNASGSQIIVYEKGIEQNRGSFGAGALEVTIPLDVRSYETLEVTFTNGLQNNITRLEVLTESQSGFFTNKDVNVYIDAFDALSTIRDYSYDGGLTYQSSNRKTYGSNASNVGIVVRDRAGNKTTYPGFSIGNIDKTNPTCVLTQAGTIGVDNWYRSNVTVSFSTRGDNLSGVRDYSFNASGSGSPKTSVQSADATGATHVGYVQDKAGNVGSCTTAVYKDTVSPTCSLSLSGSIGNNSWYVGDVTVTRSQADERSGVHERGLSATSGVTYNETTSLVRTTDGSGITYYGFVKDKAGNTGTCTVTFKRDATPPTCSVNVTSGTLGLSSWYTTNIGLSITRDDNLSGVASYGLAPTTAALNGSATGTQSAETTGITWRGRVQDGAGNQTDCSRSVKLDKTAPSCSLATSGTVGVESWYRSNVTVSLTTADGISGVLNRGVTTSSTASYNGNSAGTQTADTSGTTWYGYVQNGAGLTNSCNILTKKDTVAPTCSVSITSGTVGLNSWYTSNVGLSLTRNDLLSGINNYGLSTSSGNLNGSSTGTQSAGTKGIRWYGAVQDKAGNIGSCQSVSFKMDKTAPSCSVSFTGTLGNNNWYRSNVTVNHSTSDGVSGIRRRGLTTSSSTTYNSTTSSTQSDTSGQSWYGYTENGAGLSTSCSNSVKVDTIAPTISSTSKWNTGTTAGVSVTIAAADTISGLATDPSGTKTGLKTTVTYTATDRAGNSSSLTIYVTPRNEFQTRSCLLCNRCVLAECEIWIPCCVRYSAWEEHIPHSSNYSYPCSPIPDRPDLEVKPCINYQQVKEYSRFHCFDGIAHACWCECIYETRICLQSGTCGCETRKRDCAKCGCSSYSTWSDWQTGTCTGDASVCQTRTTYY